MIIDISEMARFSEAIRTYSNSKRYPPQQPKTYMSWVKSTSCEDCPQNAMQYFDRFVDQSLNRKIVSQIIQPLQIIEEDWDGYGALPPTEKVLKRVSQLLHDTPNRILLQLDFEDGVIVNPNGTVSFIWEKGNSDKVFCEIGEEYMTVFYKCKGEYVGFDNCKIHYKGFLQNSLSAVGIYG